MKNIIISLFSLGSFLFLTAGCAPKLAQTQYGDVEHNWQNYIQKSYKDWTPPPTPPPINDFSKNEDRSASFVVDSVPEPVLEDSGIETADNTITLPEVSNNAAVSSGTKTYTVEKGDTLWTISSKLYNDGKKWKQIQEANKDVLASPDKLKVGMVLTIPPK